MYKLAIALPLFFAAASAGIIGAPYAHGGLALAHSAPIYASPVAVAHAPLIAHAPLATSYSNSYRVIHNSVPVVKTVASPIIAHEPIIAQEPIIAHAPLISHAPLALTHGEYLHH